MKSSVRALGSLAGCVALFATLSGCGSDTVSDGSPENDTASADEELRALLPADIREAGRLTVATPYGVPPSIFVDDQGHPTGIAYDLGQAIGAQLGVTMEWHELAFASVIPGLQSGKYDLSMGVIADSPERHEILDFVDMVGNRAVFLLKKSNPAGISDLTTICGRTVGALTGAYHVQVLNDASKASCEGDDVTVKEYPSNSDAQAQVASGQIDALRGPELVLNHTAQTAGDGAVFEITEAGESDNPFGIAMQKDRGDLAEAIQGALVELHRNGEYQKILEKYDAPASATLSEPQIAINGAGTSAFPAE
nr:transporter substrate-binding domain-containing protein [Jiangella muralis]